MEFADQNLLYLGIIIVILMWLLYARTNRVRKATMEKFAAAGLLKKLTTSISPERRIWKFRLLLLSLIMLSLAMMRPQYGHNWEEMHQKGVEILIALDTSRSMLARDLRPSRLERSRLALASFTEKLEGDKIGLIPFSGTSFLMCPLTLDYSTFNYMLKNLNAGFLPVGGTNIASVIESAVELLKESSSHRILVLITDGEDLTGDAIKAAEAAKKEGVTIHTIGAGTSSGELIKITDSQGNSTYLKDKDGQPVKSRLDEATLAKIASTTGGVYSPLGVLGQGLEKVYQEKLKVMPKQDFKEKMKKLPIERYQWPLFFAFIFLVSEFLLSDRKRQQKSGAVVTAGRRLAVLLTLFTLSNLTQASELEDQAYQAYKEGSKGKAAELYKKAYDETPDNHKLAFNAGSLYLAEGELDKAEDLLGQASGTKDKSLLKKTLNNIALVNHESAKELTLKHKDLKEDMKSLEEAINDFTDAETKLVNAENFVSELAKDDSKYTKSKEIIDENLSNVKEKLAYFKKRLEELKKQQQNQQKKDEGDNKENQNDKNQQDAQKQKDGQQKEQNGDQQKQSGQEGDQQNQQQSKEDDEKKQEDDTQGAKPKDKEQKEGEKKELASPDKENEKEGEKGATAQVQQQKMSQREAERLLKSVKAKEGVIPFILQKDIKRDKKKFDGRDW